MLVQFIETAEYAVDIDADDFDADEHAAGWIEIRGTRGVPDSIRTLLEDADEIKSKLLRTAFILEQKGDLQ